jgi:hypothetical protein
VGVPKIKYLNLDVKNILPGDIPSTIGVTITP